MADDEYQGLPLDRLRIQHVDWTYRAHHIRKRSERHAGDVDVEPEWATQAVLDPNRIVRTTGGASLEVVGLSSGAGRLLKVWIVAKDLTEGEWWGASACAANARDRRAYREAKE